jgi:hypothetical protein
MAMCCECAYYGIWQSHEFVARVSVAGRLFRKFLAGTAEELQEKTADADDEEQRSMRS